MNNTSSQWAVFLKNAQDAWGATGVLFFILASLMIIDVILGVFLAVINKRVNSSASAKGMIRKVAILLGSSMSLIVNPLIPQMPIAAMTVTAFCITELISVAENMGGLGVPLPQGVLDALIKLRGEKAPLAVTVTTPVKIDTSDKPVEVEVQPAADALPGGQRASDPPASMR